MRANIMEKLLGTIIEAHKAGDTTKLANLMVKAEIVLSRENDASVLREIANGRL